MKTKHLFEEGYYLIGNKAVSKSFMFNDSDDCQKFKSKIETHLSPLCDILAYGFLRDEFQLIIRMKHREEIENYFLRKYGQVLEKGAIIPDTTYIFAQAMANMQSGYVKYFNYKYERDGGLMKGRYFRKLIESEAELDTWIEKVHSLSVFSDRNQIWTFRRKEPGFSLGKVVNSVGRCSRLLYEKYEESAGFSGFCLKSNIDMRGHFKTLPPYQIKDYNSPKKLRNLITFMLMKSHS